MSQSSEQIARQFAEANINKKTWLDVISNAKVYGAEADGSTNDTSAVNAAITNALSKSVPLYIPPGTVHSVSNMDDSLKYFDKLPKVSSNIPLASSIFKQNPTAGFHFIGDSITLGVDSTNAFTLGNRKSRGYANMFAYGVQRWGQKNIGQKILSNPSGVSNTQNTVSYGSLIDFAALFDATISPTGAYNGYIAGVGEKATYTLPNTGEASVYMSIRSNSATTVKSEISVNNSAWFSPKAGDFEVAGLSNPAALDFTGVQLQIKELIFRYPKNKLVKVRIWTEDVGKFVYLFSNIKQVGNTLACMADDYLGAFNAFDITNFKKQIFWAQNEFHSITINYLSQPGRTNNAAVKFIKNDGTLVNPSAVTGVDYFDTRTGGTIDQIYQNDTAITKWHCRSYFLTDKTKLSAQGIIGIVVNEPTDTIGIHNVAFHGLVNNVGVSGITTAGFLANQMSNVIPYVQPGDYVFVNLGMNDWINQTGTRKAFKGSYLGILQQIHTAGGTAVIIVPNPPLFSATTASYTDSRTLRFVDIVECLYEVANVENAMIIDIYSAFKKLTDFSFLMSDNIHPNDTGHRVIADTLLRLFGCTLT